MRPTTLVIALLINLMLPLQMLHAEDEAASVATAAVLPALVDAALIEAEKYEGVRWAFTMQYTAEGEDAFILRYDPRVANDNGWALLSHDVEKLTKKEKKQFNQMKRQKAPDDRLIYDKMREGLAGLTLIEEDATTVTYAVKLVDEDGESLPDALSAHLVVARVTPHIARFVIEATKPFKPAAPIKLKRMKNIQDFAPIPGGGPAFLQRVESDVKGSAFFKGFEERSVIEYSEFEQIDPAMVASEDGEAEG